MKKIESWRRFNGKEGKKEKVVLNPSSALSNLSY